MQETQAQLFILHTFIIPTMKVCVYVHNQISEKAKEYQNLIVRTMIILHRIYCKWLMLVSQRMGLRHYKRNWCVLLTMNSFLITAPGVVSERLYVVMVREVEESSCIGKLKVNVSRQCCVPCAWRWLWWCCVELGAVKPLQEYSLKRW